MWRVEFNLRRYVFPCPLLISSCSDRQRVFGVQPHRPTPKKAREIQRGRPLHEQQDEADCFGGHIGLIFVGSSERGARAWQRLYYIHYAPLFRALSPQARWRQAEVNAIFARPQVYIRVVCGQELCPASMGMTGPPLCILPVSDPFSAMVVARVLLEPNKTNLLSQNCGGGGGRAERQGAQLHGAILFPPLDARWTDGKKVKLKLQLWLAVCCICSQAGKWYAWLPNAVPPTDAGQSN